MQNVGRRFDNKLHDKLNVKLSFGQRAQASSSLYIDDFKKMLV